MKLSRLEVTRKVLHPREREIHDTFLRIYDQNKKGPVTLPQIKDGLQNSQYPNLSDFDLIHDMALLSEMGFVMSTERGYTPLEKTYVREEPVDPDEAMR